MRVRAALVSALLAGFGAFPLVGCDGGDDDATGGTRTIYVSVPLHGESAPQGRAIVNGAKVALADAGGEAGGIDVEALYLDDTSGDGGKARWDPVIVADNARRAAQDASAIAYIGELESGATRTSLPITNEAMMLHVSPGSTAVDLVEEAPGSDDVPELAQPTGERTFGRVIPDDPVQAAAGAAWARELGFRKVDVITDRSEFGLVMKEEFIETASELGLDVGSASNHPKPSGLLDGARQGAAVYVAAEEDLEVQVLAGPFAPPELMVTDSQFDAELGSGACLFEPPCPRAFRTDTESAIYVTSAAQDPEQLPSLGQDFVREYEDEFGEAPDRYAAYGYEAMAVVLDSIERAAEPDDRSAVIDAFFATEDRASVLGTYSIDEVGNTTLDAIAGYRVENGRPVFDAPLRAP
jgi:branched-chain amino acid transport system substrate-binding protein